jgi:CRP-like cAMP-binding protein
MTYLLRNVRLFESFSETDRAQLVHFMHERHFTSGETICVRGEHGSTMMVVVEGALSAVISGRDHRNHEVAKLTPGGIFGEMFCIDPAPRPVTVVANEPVTVLEMSRDDLSRMRQEAPRAAAALISAVLCEVLRRLRSVDARIDRELQADGCQLSEDSDDPSRASHSNVPGPWEACFARLRGSA